MIEIIQAIVLGIVEGLTEFLPISSTGHLIVAQDLIGYKDTAELFTVVVQLGAISAVIWYFRRDLYNRIRGALSLDKSHINFISKLLVGILPVSILALFLDKFIQSISKPSVVAIALIMGGFLLLWVENSYKNTKAKIRQPHHKDEPRLDSITYRQALYVGVIQTLSLIPGVSRSGSSIVGGLLGGLDRVTATAFSFYLSIPIMIAASGYKIAKEHESIVELPGGSLGLVVGTATAFITALFAISWLLKYVSKNSFKGFAIYRIVFGSLILFLVMTRVLR